MLHVWLDKTCVILAPPYLTPKKMIFGSMLFTQTVRSVHVEEWTTFTPSFSVFRVIHCKTVCLVINSLTPLLSKSVWQSRSGSHSYHPTLQRRQQRQKGKEDGWGWAGGRTTVVVGVSFDGGDHSNICIYSNQRMNTVHGANKDKPMGGLRPCCGLRRSRRHPSSSLGGTQGSGVGTERPPERSGVRGATCSPWWISILFVSIFPSNFCPRHFSHRCLTWQRD